MREWKDCDIVATREHWAEAKIEGARGFDSEGQRSVCREDVEPIVEIRLLSRVPKCVSLHIRPVMHREMGLRVSTGDRP